MFQKVIGRMLSIAKLRSFVAVADAGSFRAAAETLGVSQPVLSEHVAELEKILGLALMHRTTRRVDLTNDGVRLLTKARRILIDFDTIASDFRSEADLESGRVVVACVPTMAGGLFAAALASFSDRFKNVVVQLHDVTTVEMGEAILRGEVDFGLGPEIDDAAFQFMRLATDPFLLVCPKRSELAARGHIRGPGLATLPLVTLVRTSNVGRITEAYFAGLGLPFRPRFEVNHHYTLGGFVRAGLGYGILPEQALALTGDPGLVGIAITHPRCTRQVGILTRKGDRLSPAASAFHVSIREAMRSAGAPE